MFGASEGLMLRADVHDAMQRHQPAKKRRGGLLGLALPQGQFVALRYPAARASASLAHSTLLRSAILV